MTHKAVIGDRIKVLETRLGFSANQLGKDARLGNGTVGTWIDKPVDFQSEKIDAFIKHHQINPTWWLTGEGEVFLKSPDRADRIELYERLIKEKDDHKSFLQAQCTKWEQEAFSLRELLAQALKR
jgi:hypothetical protein